jgi:3'(2'), 5'-bisphosphate nucleotidase
MNAPQLSDGEVALRAAEAAARSLLDLRQRLVAAGAQPGDLRAEGDRQSHITLTEILATFAPHDPVLSEEGADDTDRLASERVWIIDPLDGTREFSEPPRDDWAIHVALAVNGEPTAGAVALPALGLTLSTLRPPAPTPPAGDVPVLVVSRSRPPALVADVADALGATVIEMGSAGAKAMAVVRGEADVYVHAGGQYEWDSCAPVAVAKAAGLHVSRIDGSPLVYNNRDPYLPDLVVCRRELSERVLAACAAAAA